MKMLRIFICFIFICTYTQAQVNLVPNPSFELYDTCPGGPHSLVDGTIQYALGWFQPNTYFNSSDYYNICDTLSSNLGVPENPFGFQFANSGVAYVGICPFFLGDVREYIETELIDTLQQNHRYCVTFYVSFANKSKKAIGSLGAYLSTSVLLDNRPGNPTILVQPQVLHPPNLIINDTLNWTLISSYYYATGGEKFITIGNFLPDSLTPFQLFPNAVYPYAYYYIDDVSVILCDSIQGLSENSWDKVQLVANPVREYLELHFNSPFQGDLLLFDLTGKQLKSFAFYEQAQNDFRLPVAHLPSGMYLLQIQDERHRVTKRFVKE